MARHRQATYPLSLIITVVGLSPYVALTTAVTPVTEQITADLGTDTVSVQVAAGLGNAAYAVGLLLAAQLGLRFSQRHVFLVSATVLVAGTVLAGTAGDVVLFTVGRVLEGLAAGAMVISALPPLLSQFDAHRLPISAAAAGVGLFGAASVGPIIGGYVAAWGQWRAMFLVVAALGVVVWLLALRGFPHLPPVDPDQPIDAIVLGLAAIAVTAIFCSTSLLSGHPWLSWWVLPWASLGLLLLGALIVVESRRTSPLVPVRSLTTQLPVTGLIAVMVGGATFVAGLEVAQTYLSGVLHRSPSDVAATLWPTPIGTLVACVLLAVLTSTRLLPVLVDLGLLAMAAAAALMLGFDGRLASSVVPVAAGLFGFGAGATVPPGLFLIAFGIPIGRLGRALAMVQLLRSTATYAVAPIVTYIVMAAARPADGVDDGLIVILVAAIGGLLATLVLPWVSRAHLRRPDLASWLAGDDAALPSPPTGAALRTGR